MTDEFHFIRPLEAPVFSPSADEFKDPLTYINKIRPIAEKAGICKIRPPPNWQPPFAVDVDSFKFTPRVQRLNELEAKTRIKLNFLDQIAKFWELQGSRLKIPTLDKKALDLYSLHKYVQAEGGKDHVNNEKKWNRLAIRMGYCQAKNYGAVLKSHYEKLLYPFDVFQESKDKLKEKPSVIEESPKKAATTKTSPLKLGRGLMGSKTVKRTKTPAEIEEEEGSSVIENTSKELRRLAFYGAGPKMAGFNVKSSQNLQLQDTKQRNQKAQPVQDPLAKYMCQVCDRGDVEHSMLLCDGCDDSYHTFCLQPPLMEVPKGDWRCPKCVAEEVGKPGEAFGFEQAQREYTLQQFGQMADQFKQEYFNMPVHIVPSELVEKEFWRIVSAIDEDVTVEYGADLHSMDHGSGFPTEGSSKVHAGDESYIKSGWNLNNLPVLPGSVLGHINADISGMKVPWMYVGMCFATFCWHNEDHWSYSINYLHWGEAKTWYGVPGVRADDFENAMKRNAPELFQSQPDLLHQLVTIMNPNILMKAGVPVYRMDQKAGEFIITFPRAYHAGFNQGYNFAEAVNFAPADWLAMGRSCIEHYSSLHRYCVFSHDELVCKMASQPGNLDRIIAIATEKDIHKMFEFEKDFRRIVLNWGAKRCERVEFEMLPDDERICDFCKTTCFLSAVSCSCTTNRLVCLKHYDKLCECSPASHILKYRFTLDELPTMLTNLRERTEPYEQWLKTMMQLNYGEGVKSVEEKMEFETLRDLVKEAEVNKYPKTAWTDRAIACLKESEKCAEVAQRLAMPMVRTRTRTEDTKGKLAVSDLAIFMDQMRSIPVRLKEEDTIAGLFKSINEFQTRAKELLKGKNPQVDNIKACLAAGLALEFDLPELTLLQRCLDRRKWLEQAKSLDEQDTLWTVEHLRKCIDTGKKLDPNPEIVQRISSLTAIMIELQKWEGRAKKVISPAKKNKVEDLEILLEEAKQSNIALPSLPIVRDMIRKRADWIQKVEGIVKAKDFPFLEELEALATKGDNIPVYIKELDMLRSQIDGANMWKFRCSKAFMKKKSTIVLLEAMIPRSKILDVPTRGMRKELSEGTTVDEMATLLGMEVSGLRSDEALKKALQRMQAAELTQIREVRKANLAKRNNDTGEGRYCICRAHFNDGFMIRCEICLEWFHATCVPLPKLETQPLPGVSSHTMTVHRIATGRMKYYCPGCGRSRRPDLETVSELLTELKDLPVLFAESLALHHLAKRALAWLESVQHLVNRPDIQAALKAAESKLCAQSALAPEPKARMIKFPENIEDDVDSDEIMQEFDPSCSENTYMASVPRNGHQRKANLTPLRCHPGLLRLDKLPKVFLREIEEAVLLADLMEVRFEESDKLWTVLQSSRPRPVVPSLLNLQKMLEMEIVNKDLNRIMERQKMKKIAVVRGIKLKRGGRHFSGQSVDDGLSDGPPKRKLRASDCPAEKKKSSSNQEYDEDCAAEECRQPGGKEVNWVQCDKGCELWFHLICVGLKKNDVKKMEHYECPKCKNKKVKAGSVSEDSSRESDSGYSQSGKQSICSNKRIEDIEESDGEGAEKGSKKSKIFLTRDPPERLRP